MDKLERSADLLKKVLNSKIFLDNYPIIKRVEVESSKLSITIILIFDESTKDYWDQKPEIHSFIRDIRKMIGIPNIINLYILP
jgi:hypothetical protein